MHLSSAMGAGMGRILVRLLHNVFSLAPTFKFHSAKCNLHLSSRHLPFLHLYQRRPASSDSASKLIDAIIPRRAFSLCHPSLLSSTCTPTHHFPYAYTWRNICAPPSFSRVVAGCQPFLQWQDRVSLTTLADGPRTLAWC